MFSYRIHSGDYEKETKFMDLVTEGIFARLRNLYFSTGKPLPLMPAVIAREIRLTSKEQSNRMRILLQSAFEYTPDGFRRTEWDLQIEKAREVSEERRKSVGKRKDRATGDSTNVPTFVATNVRDSATNVSTNDRHSPIPSPIIPVLGKDISTTNPPPTPSEINGPPTMTNVSRFVRERCPKVDQDLLSVEIESIHRELSEKPKQDWQRYTMKCIKRILSDEQTRRAAMEKAAAEGRSEVFTGRYQRGPNADKVRPGQKTNEYGQPLNDDGGLEVVL